MADTDATAEQLDDVIASNDTSDSIRGAMEDAMEEHGVEISEDALVPVEEAAAPDPKPIETKPEDAPAKAEDAPDEKSVPESEVAAKPPEDDGQDKTDQAKDAKEEEDATGSLTPPGSWSAEEKAEFTDLPAKAQSAILRREGDRDRAFNQKQAELNQDRQRYAAMDQVIEPFKDNFALNGIDPANLFNQYLAIDRSMSNDPMGTLKMLAGRVGVDLSSLNQEAAGEEESPELAAMRRELAETRSMVSSFQTDQTQQQEDAQTQRHNELQGQMEDFALQADSAGAPLHPHFEELRFSMGSLMTAAVKSGAPIDMQTAYDQALWADPGHRGALLAAQKRADKATAEKDRKAHARKAVAAGASVAGSPGGAEPPRPVGTVGEELKKAFAAAS